MQDPSQRKPMDSTRRVGVPRSFETTGRAAVALVSDQRYRALSAHARLALLEAIIAHSDGAGKFFIKYETWSKSSDLAPRTIMAAVKAAEATALLVREAHAQASGRQGSNTFHFDPRLF